MLKAWQETFMWDGGLEWEAESVQVSGSETYDPLKNPSPTPTKFLRNSYRTDSAQEQPQLRQVQLLLGDVVLVLAD